MDRFIWAFGSMFFVMLILYFLPFGFTKKGKWLIVFTGFVLALGGLAAIASFSLWMTLTILAVLALLCGFMMDRRLGGYLYEKSMAVKQSNKTALEVDASEKELNEKDLKNIFSQYEQETEKINVRSIHNQMHSEKIAFLPVFEEEDISFINARKVESQEEESAVTGTRSKGYLSEIEALLEKNMANLDDRKELQGLSAADGEELPVLTFDDKPDSTMQNEPAKEIKEVNELEELPVLTIKEEGGKEA